MVVPVLITSCQVSDQWNSGPVTAQTKTISTASKKALGLPATVATLLAAPSNQSIISKSLRENFPQSLRGETPEKRLLIRFSVSPAISIG
jgi:hypothetical protein